MADPTRPPFVPQEVWCPECGLHHQVESCPAELACYVRWLEGELHRLELQLAAAEDRNRRALVPSPN